MQRENYGAGSPMDAATQLDANRNRNKIFILQTKRLPQGVLLTMNLNYQSCTIKEVCCIFELKYIWKGFINSVQE